MRTELLAYVINKLRYAENGDEVTVAGLAAGFSPQPGENDLLWLCDVIKKEAGAEGIKLECVDKYAIIGLQYCIPFYVVKEGQP